MKVNMEYSLVNQLHTANQYWQHKGSGDIFAIRMVAGQIEEAVGPLYYKDVTFDNLRIFNFSGESEDAQWCAEFAQDFRLCLEPYVGDEEAKGKNPNWGGKREGAGRPRLLPNGCEIVRGHMVEVGLMQTEIPGKPEAWLWWCEGQSLVSDQGMLWGTRVQAIQRINVWLEGIGLAFDGKEIVEH